MRIGPRPARAAALIASLALSFCAAAGAPAKAPKVVATIQPLHSLVSAVMAGAGKPRLLVRGAGSPHDYSLTPADARALSHAELVVWVGEAMETVLARPISVLAAKAVVLEAIEAEGVEVLEGRAGGAWQAQAPADEPGPEAPTDEHGPETVNGHIWLDPRNAIAIARATAEALAKLDPANAARYRANADSLGDSLRELEKELAVALAPVRRLPYIVFHDAYPYFERRFGLNAVGSITISPERAPGAKRIGEIRDRLRETGAVCVFTEPQFEPALARTVVEGTKARIAVLDPLGVDLAPGPSAYFALLRGIARSLRACLTEGS